MNRSDVRVAVRELEALKSREDKDQAIDKLVRFMLEKGDGYQGWTNFETWVVVAHIDNERRDYEKWTAYVEKYHDDPYGISVAMKNYYTENTPVTTGVYASLLNGALSDVNWREIAHSLIETYSEGGELNG